jgi:hypothetical protein
VRLRRGDADIDEVVDQAGTVGRTAGEIDDTVVIREEVVTTTCGYSRQATELALGITHRFCAALMMQKWRPLSVHFTHNPPSDLTLHRRILAVRSSSVVTLMVLFVRRPNLIQQTLKQIWRWLTMHSVI